MAKIHDPLALPENLRKHWAFHGARLQRKETYRGHDVYLAEGGPHYDAKGRRVTDSVFPGPGEISKEDLWMKDGYYVAAWGLPRGKIIMGFPLYFKLNHDMNLKYRSEARLNSAYFTAKEAIDAMISVGLLENWSGGILLPAYA